MTLIIAEKPSLARNIADGIRHSGAGDPKRRDGYIEIGEYLVTWAFGHLFSLCDIEKYSPQPNGSTRWSMINLPCFPQEFSFELRKNSDGSVDPGVKKQFRLIRDLCCRPDVDRIVNAGDADREGEIIVRLCVSHAMEGQPQKPNARLWLPDQTPETISQALAEMKDAAAFDNLANEGLARTYIDWLYGVNLTRYATLKTGTLMRVGRVIIPIVRAIYDRDLAIRNFTPDIYYALISRAETNGIPVELTSKEKFPKEQLAQAQAMCDRYNAQSAVVTSVKKKKDILAPGKLYSLSKLQNFLGKKYKMSMSESLEIVQGLYEKGYLTYPRTNSEYLATAEKDKIRKIIENAKKLGYQLVFKESKTIFDDSKIESHSALTPTYKIPNKSQLSEREMMVYSAVFRRFAAVFCAEDCVVHRTEIKIALGDCEEFTLKGMVIAEKGWMKYDDSTQRDRTLPPLNKGDIVQIDFRPVEKETSPPKHYTIETLNNYLKNPFREDKAKAAEENTDDTEEYRAIFEGLELGTEATRTGIIDNARKSGYIELKKDVYHILPAGEFLIESLSQMGISMDKYKTAEVGRSLKRVFRGESSVRDSLDIAQKEIAQVFAPKEISLGEDTDIGFFGDTVGVCPICGKEVTRTKRGYGCRGYKDGCKFGIFSPLCGRAIPKSAMEILLRDGRTPVLQGFVSKKSGKSFDASLKLENGEIKFDFSN
jgi:DNA topoisomerase-3